MKIRFLFIAAILFVNMVSCSSKNIQNESKDPNIQPDTFDLTKYKRAYFAGGCFWCVESIYESVLGIKEVVSGYAGGTAEGATYKKVSTGVTEHAEAVEVYYDPKEMDYKTLLVVFFDSHDPTTLNRQGPDYGRQYRSAIFYQNEEEKNLALTTIDSLNKSGKYKDKIVTEVVPLTKFYAAEDYHQDYKKRNPENSYIQNVSMPRLKKFQEKHPELLKKKK